jgi:RNA polymerase sigma-70 factor, ECF subfamily
VTAVSVEGLARVARTASGPALATVARLLGDLQRAEDAVQDAFEVALRTWPARGVPDDPAAWLAPVARNRAIDHLRRESSRRDREAAASRELPPPLPTTVHPVADDQLRLLATCCHPALSVDAQVALTPDGAER